MKATEKKKPIHTTPKGAWEGGVVNERADERTEVTSRERLNEITTDSQGNGYPLTNKQGHEGCGLGTVHK